MTRWTRGEQGAAAVEMAIVLPLLLLFIAGIVDLGRLAFVQVMVTNAAREGARMVSMGYSTADANTRVNNASPAATSTTFVGPLAKTYVTCPANPLPTDAASATVSSTTFQWLMLDGVLGLFGGPTTPPQPTATASMRCLG